MHKSAYEIFTFKVILLKTIKAISILLIFLCVIIHCATDTVP